MATESAKVNRPGMWWQAISTALLGLIAFAFGAGFWTRINPGERSSASPQR